jgi:hypothetical protein
MVWIAENNNDVFTSGFEGEIAKDTASLGSFQQDYDKMCETFLPDTERCPFISWSTKIRRVDENDASNEETITTESVKVIFL